MINRVTWGIFKRKVVAWWRSMFGARPITIPRITIPARMWTDKDSQQEEEQYLYNRTAFWLRPDRDSFDVPCWQIEGEYQVKGRIEPETSGFWRIAHLPRSERLSPPRPCPDITCKSPHIGQIITLNHQGLPDGERSICKSCGFLGPRGVDLSDAREKWNAMTHQVEDAREVRNLLGSPMPSIPSHTDTYERLTRLAPR